MLPDLPKLKVEIRDACMRYVSLHAHARIGLFSEVPRHVVHEGLSMRVERANGDAEETRMMQASAETSLQKSEVESLTQDQRLTILRNLGDQMAESMAGKLYASLTESLDRAGQSVSANGRPLDGETVLLALEKLEIDFGKDGMPKMPSFSGDVQALRAAFVQISNDPSLSARYANLIEQKRTNWRDREASRKLVG